MAVRHVLSFDEQAAITATGDSFMVNPLQEVSVVAQLTAGTPTTGCRVQMTLDEVDKILAGTATWVDSPMGNRTGTGAEKVLRPVTGVRLKVTDGTWSFLVRQA